MSEAEELMQALDRSVERAMAHGPMAVLFSGGLDSGVLAALAKRHGPTRLYTIGIEGSHDLRMSEEAARLMDLPWSPIVLTPDEIIAACRETLSIVAIDHPVVLSFELPLQVIASRAEEKGLMSGQGADELFGGYNRYLTMTSEEQRKGMDEDLAKVLETGAPMDHVIAGHYHKVIHHPFLDPAVRRLAQAIPVEDRVRDGVRKVPLRSVASAMGLELIAGREKKAAQYGSGAMKVMKSRARKEGLSLSDYVRTLRPEQDS